MLRQRALCLLTWLLLLPTTGWCCTPVIESISAARGVEGSQQAAAAHPATGWVPVTLPDRWSQRWPGHDGTVWYRIDWHSDCTQRAGPPSLVIESIVMAGAVYSNDDLLWADLQLDEPMSRSWNMPRHWILPGSGLRPGRNTLWFKVQGHGQPSQGLGLVHLLDAPQAHALMDSLQLHRRTMFTVSLTLSLAMGGMFAGMWLFYRRRAEHGWFALTSFAWAGFIWNVLATDTWPFPDTQTLMRANTLALLAYAYCFRMFVLRLLVKAPSTRQTRAMAALGGMGAASILLSPQALLASIISINALVAVGAFIMTCLELIVRSAHRANARNRPFAIVALVFLFAAAHDLLAVNGLLYTRGAYAPIAGIALSLVISIVLAARVARNMRRVERFSQRLNAAVETACTDLEISLRQERELAIANSRLKERLQMSYDLHDSLGAALGRAIALAEQPRHGTGRSDDARHLSTLRSLRDDLRQIIDSGTATDPVPPQTPTDWLAPVRHRFSTLFDELDIHSRWQVPAHWDVPPDARQCLEMKRLLEEALTNVIKHADARNVDVTLHIPMPGALELRIEDDGVGFDAPHVRQHGAGLGMHSMQARAGALGGELQIQSRAGHTRISLHLRDVQHALKTEPQAC
ncbi:ATP-binding protein [Luteimonas sp. TWI662]|uniref:sensor histidine kinase n=1 Tax=Luteimonas sp. TWI662 TaxID=3136789 RepID=UPI00320A4E09